MSMRRTRRYVADLIQGRRPQPFQATPEDLAELRAAIMLRSAVPGGAEPSEAFVAELRQRLAAELAEPSAPAGNTSPATRTRRRVVRTASLAAASVAVGVAADRALTAGGGATPAQTLAPDDGVWRAAVAVEDLPEGTVVPFDLGPVVGFVQRADGQLRAVSGICTHLGCRLALDNANNRLNCPCHRTAFTVNGEVIYHQLASQPPALPHLQVRQSGDTIEILVPPNPS